MISPFKSRTNKTNVEDVYEVHRQYRAIKLRKPEDQPSSSVDRYSSPVGVMHPISDDNVDPGSQLNWLNQTHDYMTTRSKPWRQLRARALQLLTRQILPKYNFDVSRLSPEQHDLIFKELNKALQQEIVWDAAKWDVEVVLQRYLYRQFQSHEENGVELERQKALAMLLRRRPQHYRALQKYSCNVFEPDLRFVAWSAALSKDSARRGYFEFVTSNQSSNAASTFRSSVYQLCEDFMSEYPALSNAVLSFKFIRNMEKILQFLFYHDLSEQGLPTFEILLLSTTLSNRQRQYLACSIMTVSVLMGSHNHSKELLENGMFEFDDMQTAMAVEMIVCLMEILPKDYCDKSNHFYTQVANEVEEMLSYVNPKLYTHIRRLMEGPVVTDELETIKTFSELVKEVFGIFLIGTCSIEISLFLVDQLIFSSQEQTGSKTLPSCIHWCSLFLTGILHALQETFHTSSSNYEMRQKLKARLHLVHAHDLQVILQKRVLPVSMRQTLWALDPTVEKRTKLSVTGPFQKVWDDDWMSVSEEDLIHAELNIEKRLLEWDQRRLKKATERRAALLKRWRTISKYIIYWSIFVGNIRLRAQRKREIRERAHAESLESKAMELLAQQRAQQKYAMDLAAQEAARLEEERRKQMMEQEQHRAWLKESVIWADEPVPGHEELALNDFGKTLLTIADTFEALFKGKTPDQDADSALLDEEIFTDAYESTLKDYFGHVLTDWEWDELEKDERKMVLGEIDRIRARKMREMVRLGKKPFAVKQDEEETSGPVWSNSGIDQGPVVLPLQKDEDMVKQPLPELPKTTPAAQPKPIEKPRLAPATTSPESLVIRSSTVALSAKGKPLKHTVNDILRMIGEETKTLFHGPAREVKAEMDYCLDYEFQLLNDREETMSGAELLLHQTRRSESRLLLS